MLVNYIIEKDDWKGFNIMKRVFQDDGIMSTHFVKRFDTAVNANEYCSYLERFDSYAK